MRLRGNDGVFAGAIPELYERHLVPLIFEPYAADIASRVAQRGPLRTLEIAAGTGAATRHLARALPESASIVATDLNQPMLDKAAAVGTARPVEWRQADAMRLPFADEAFDAVVCQFGAMFFPDKRTAFSEARRVLRRGGVFVFSVWDRIECNDFAEIVTRSVAMLWPDDPPGFLARIPHGYHDTSLIAEDLRQGGFTRTPEFSTLAERSRADSAQRAAMAYCHGTPLRTEIETRDASRLAEATNVASAAIADRFGPDRVDGAIQAHVIIIEK